MIAGLPWHTWALAIGATVPGLLIAGAFFHAHKGDTASGGPGSTA